jgi:rhamnose utilization protein RhaD (predicted bifunctional aldolase and dehydrogenase)
VTVDRLLGPLRVVSARLGADLRHVQGPGGNTSVKVSATAMYIKASGYRLAEANERDIFTLADFAALRVAVRAGGDAMPTGNADVNASRPSIEAAVHAVLPHRYVVHTHTLSAIATCCRADAIAVLRERVAGCRWTWVDYATPGLALARRVLAAAEAEPDACVFFLANHGLIVGADTAEEAESTVNAIDQAIGAPPRVPAASLDHGELATQSRRYQLVRPSNDEVHNLALDPVAMAIVTGGSLYPDHVVFLGAGVGTLPPDEGPARQPASLRPKLWLVPGKCSLIEPGLPPAAELMALALARVAGQIPQGVRVRYLSAADEAELDGMAAEQHRRRLAVPGPRGPAH